MESVYIETTIISYLVARPSRDLLVAAHQQMTRDWWDTRKKGFECYISPLVLAAGDPDVAKRRASAAAEFPVLEVTPEAESLTSAILKSGAIPPNAVGDAGHVAVATVGNIDYLLTWNCTHLANAQMTRGLFAVCDRQGYTLPVICTPEELMGE